MAEATLLRNNALPFPVYGLPYGIVYPFRDADGDLVSAATTPDAEISKNGDTFADCTAESTEIATNSGVWYLTLTGTELTTDVATIQAKSATAGMKTTVAVLMPVKLPTERAGTSASGGVSTSTVVLDASAVAVDDYYNGMIVAVDIDGTVQVRMITDYTGSTQTCTVVPDWTTAPDNNDTFTVYNTPYQIFKKGDLRMVSGSAVSTSSAQIGVNVVNAGGTAWASGSLTSGVFASGAITATAIAADAIGASELAADAVAEIADAVWDEDATAHQTQGTFGQAIGDPGATTDTIYKAVVTDATGATVGVDVAAVLADTGTDGVVVASINNGAITAAAIATNAIDADAMADGAITAATFAAGAIDATAIANSAIDAATFAAGAIDAAALAADAGTEIGTAVWATAARTITGLTAAALADFFDTDSGTTYASAVAGSVVKETADNAGGSSLTAAEIADAVWDEDATGHQTQGSFGQAIGDPAADTNTIYAAVVTGAAGATIAADIVDIEGKVDDLESRLGTPSDLGSGATVAANLVDIESQTDDIGVAGAGLTNINLPDQTMNITGNITGNLSGSVGSVTGNVGGNVAGSVGSVTGNVGGNVVGSVGSVATDGITSGSLDATAITEIQSGLATAAALDTVDNFLDTEIAAIKAKTDSLTFTVAGQVDSNIQYVNDVQVTGTGAVGDEWGP